MSRTARTARTALGLRDCRLALVLLLLGAADNVLAQEIEQRVQVNIRGGRTELLEDGALHVVLCGTGSPLPAPDRAGPCTAVLAAGRFFVVDAGPGATESIQILGLPRGRLSALFLTHFHSDHIGEVGELVFSSWAGGRSAPLPIYGPVGVEQVVAGFQQAYALDSGYRTAHHGAEYMPPTGARAEAREIRFDGTSQSTVVYEQEGLRVTAILVDHPPIVPALGYRFDFGGRCVVVSGDTKRSAALLSSAKGCDLLVHEVLSDALVRAAAQALSSGGNARLAAILTDTLDYHTFPRDVFALAAEAGVRALALTHFVPAVPAAQAATAFTQGREAFAGEIHVGSDGMHFVLPAGSTEIRLDSLSPSR